MTTMPTIGRIRVLVASDHALLADTVAGALGNRGHQVLSVEWSGVHDAQERELLAESALAEVGLMMVEQDRSSRLDAVASVLKRTSIPWLVLTSSPRGPVWGAFLAAGAEVVAPRDTGLEEIIDMLVSVARGQVVTPAGERAELVAAWRGSRSEPG